ncbi:MAG TPA: CPBP family glutamic-type intramembrane protease [Gemmatimonadales bacterium]|nr:CPBP family glutamic-type intramembrane protease [Gemmatimonadales bacterium]
MANSGYWNTTRAPRYSLTFALPLLVAYEVLARMISGDTGIRNGADVLLKSLFLLLGGRHGLTIFAVVLLGTGLFLIVRDWRQSGAPRPGYFLGMTVESLIYACLFGGVTSALTSLLLRGPGLLMLVQAHHLALPTQLMVSLGAGIYEELLFRVILVSALARLAVAGFGWKPLGAGIFATILGALIFSGFHYIGPLGDTLTLSSFVFRMVAGLLLSGLFLLRGFGIAAWTHALYDVLLTLLG